MVNLTLIGCFAVFPIADFLGKPLDDYVAKLPLPVHVERMGNRSGLIRARLRGNSIMPLRPNTTVNIHLPAGKCAKEVYIVPCLYSEDGFHVPSGPSPNQLWLLASDFCCWNISYSLCKGLPDSLILSSISYCAKCMQ